MQVSFESALNEFYIHNLKVLHLQRKFTSFTETFIANQINALDYFEQYAFTIKYINSLQVNARVFYPKNHGFISLKILSGKHKKFLSNNLKEINPHIVHCHYLTDAAFFHPLTKELNVPKVCSCYGYDVSSFPNKYGILSKNYFKSVFQEYDFFLAMSEDMKDDLVALGCDINKVKIHYHGIDTRKFATVCDRRKEEPLFKLLTIGSLEERKGHLSVLKAVQLIIERAPETQLSYTIVGNGTLKESLEKYVFQNGLTEIVSFREAVPHGMKFLDYLIDADVFLLPSIKTSSGDKEGIPGTIVEAMSSGLPVISTYHAGIPYVIQDEETGFLVAENDDIAISDRILALYKEREIGVQIGKRAREYALNNLDLFDKAKSLEKIYNSLLSTD